MTFTHTGSVNTGRWHSRSVKLRQTKMFWISEIGEKFRKSSGYRAGSDAWDATKLDLNSIQEIANDQPNPQ